MAQFVDWDLAAATAAALGKSGPAVSYEEAANAVTDLRSLADEAAGHVTEFTGLKAMIQGPPVRVVDRRDWAVTNIEGLREVIQPLAERLAGGKSPGAIVSAIGSRLTGMQAGTVLAYLSGRVLGQYEVFAADPGQLLLVAPNIVEAERKLGADPRDFRLWVCLHEVTHRVQFTAVPWMRGYFLGEVGAFVDASQLNQDQLAERVRRGIGALADVVRDPNSRVSVLDLVQTPAQKTVLDRLTALMTLLEGHAEFVMDGVGPEVIPSVEEIRGKFNRRREGGNPMDRVIRKILGVDVKMRQYAEGRKFVHGVVERVGMQSFNKIWQSPLTIPRLDELGDPEAWIARVLGSSALNRPVKVPSTTPAAPQRLAPPAATIAEVADAWSPATDPSATDSPATAPAPESSQVGLTEEPPAPVPTVPDSADTAVAEAGIAEPTEVAGLPAEELTTLPAPESVLHEPTPQPDPLVAEDLPAAGSSLTGDLDGAPAEIEPGPPTADTSHSRATDTPTAVVIDTPMSWAADTPTSLATGTSGLVSDIPDPSASAPEPYDAFDPAEAAATPDPEAATPETFDTPDPLDPSDARPGAAADDSGTAAEAAAGDEAVAGQGTAAESGTAADLGKVAESGTAAEPETVTDEGPVAEEAALPGAETIPEGEVSHDGKAAAKMDGDEADGGSVAKSNGAG